MSTLFGNQVLTSLPKTFPKVTGLTWNLKTYLNDKNKFRGKKHIPGSSVWIINQVSVGFFISPGKIFEKCIFWRHGLPFFRSGGNPFRVGLM